MNAWTSVIVDDTVQLKISAQQYVNLGRQANTILKYYLHSQIKETNQTLTRDDNIVFNKDDFIKPVSFFLVVLDSITAFSNQILEEDVIEIGKPVLLGIQIANTLSYPLHNGYIHIDGLGINQILPVK